MNYRLDNVPLGFQYKIVDFCPDHTSVDINTLDVSLRLLLKKLFLCRVEMVRSYLGTSIAHTAMVT